MCCTVVEGVGDALVYVCVGDVRKGGKRGVEELSRFACVRRRKKEKEKEKRRKCEMAQTRER